MLKISALYREKPKSFIPKKNVIKTVVFDMPRKFQQMEFAVPIFSEGFGQEFLLL